MSNITKPGGGGGGGVDDGGGIIGVVSSLCDRVARAVVSS